MNTAINNAELSELTPPNPVGVNHDHSG